MPGFGCQVIVGSSPAQKLLVRAGSWGLCSRLSCSCHLKSVPGQGSPTSVPYLHATPKRLSPFVSPKIATARGPAEAEARQGHVPSSPQSLWAHLSCSVGVRRGRGDLLKFAETGFPFENFR